MCRIPSICALLVATSFVVITWSNAEAQRRGYFGGRLNTIQLIRRIEQLERRVTVLERAQPGQQHEEVPMSLEQAEQQLATAKAQQVFSEKMHGKGYLSEAEMEADKFAVARAVKMLEFTKAAHEGKPTEQITVEMRILEAEHNLAAAKRQLRFAEGLAAKGFASSDLAAHRRAVDDAQKMLLQEQARQ